MSNRRRGRGLLATVCVIVLMSSVIPTAIASPPLDGADKSILGREPQLTPGALGNGGLNGLQFADPTEGLSLIQPPAADNSGSAQLQYPLAIPKGRGIAPDLSLAYDSGGGNGWLGLGWDLSQGEIDVDTRWGVPRFDPTYETESYSLDGDLLTPTAIRSDLNTDGNKRVAERQDYTRRVETQYEYIIRHGDSPKTYFWEVKDKLGGIRWYGGFPDNGGPYGGPGKRTSGATRNDATRDPSAILEDSNHNAVKWYLSAQRDVGVNMIRYHYVQVDGSRPKDGAGGTDRESLGKKVYLSSIDYTGASQASPNSKITVPPGADPIPHEEDPAYQVKFVRDTAIDSVTTRRKDILIDARGGFLEVTSEKLRRVEVWYGAPVHDPVTDAESPRTYNQLSVAYELHYGEGAYGKTILTSVDQIGSDNKVVATHAFTYFDDVRDASGKYTGFGTDATWNTGTDDLKQPMLNSSLETSADTSALGAAVTNQGDVHAYIGFNPLDPLKTGSFGGSFTIKGGATEGLAELIDLNGDGLPDKVFRKDGAVWFRLNTGGPGAPTQPTYGDAVKTGQLPGLSYDYNVGVAGGPEVYFVATVQFNIAGDVSVGRDYFADVNADGLPDFVSNDSVKYNHLVKNTDGVLVPTFTSDSTDTRVPIDVNPVKLDKVPEISAAESDRAANSPLQDVVRRWVAPFDGHVTVTGDVTFNPTVDPTNPTAPYKGDGVRVAIQHNADQRWAATLTTPGATASPTNVTDFEVKRGARIYFRLGSVDDGAADEVAWNPTITYVDPATAPLDVNGLDQLVYHASSDFTLAGRPGTTVLLGFGGTVHFEALVKKTAKTTDDVHVVLLHNGVPVPGAAKTLNAADINTAGVPVVADFDVAIPTATTSDTIEARLESDSPIDIHAVDWSPILYYTKATAIQDGKIVELPVVDSQGNHIRLVTVPTDTDVYGSDSRTAPNAPWVSDLDRTVTAHGTIDVAANDKAGQDGDVVFTVKTRDGVVAKQSFHIAKKSSARTDTLDLPVTVEDGKDYWFDLTIRSGGLSDKTSNAAVQLQWKEGAVDKHEDVPSVLNWAGHQGMWPIGYRGWAVAGYNAADGRETDNIDESAFVIDPDSFPKTATPPTGFNDPNYKDPSPKRAYLYTAGLLKLLDANHAVTGTLPVWRGAKDNLVASADHMRSSRYGVDTPSLGVGGAGTVSAVQHIGLTAPVLSLTAGLGPATVSFGAGPSFGLLDYMDMNGDGFPDIVAPAYVHYTGPRGGFYGDKGAGIGRVNMDTTFSVGGGFNGSAVSIKGNAKGKANATKGQSAGKAGDSEAQYGANLGGSFGITTSFTNPTVLDKDKWNGPLDKIGTDPGAPLQWTVADVNGDGLPDLIKAGPGGMFVRFNLGYGFTPEDAQYPWATGGFESGESYAGSIGPQLGFSSPNKEFAGGFSLSESVDLLRFSWADVDGDGVIDRLRKTTDDSGKEIVLVAFGTGAGLQPEVNYGDLQPGSFRLAGQEIPTGPMINQDRADSVGAGFDFTVGIGPLCEVACYIILNPGVHFEHALSNTIVDLTDVNGDGAPDSVTSTADNTMKVRLNQKGRTNLLKSVRNPVGGTIDLDYARGGNTVAQPQPTWDLASVTVNDGRNVVAANGTDLDGADVQLTTFTYSNGRFDPLTREQLGYDTVVSKERDFDSTLKADSPVLRQTVQHFINDNVFEGGLLKDTTLEDKDGKPLTSSLFDWSFFDVRKGAPADLNPQAGDPQNVRFLGMSVAPLQSKVEHRWFDGAGNIAEKTWNTFEYDDLGNIRKQVDVGQPGTTADDLIATTVYTTCLISASDDLIAGMGCHDTANFPPVPRSPIWNADRCPTWVSIPAIFEIRDSSGKILKHRDGSPALCDNASITHLVEDIGGGQQAVTDLSYDDWGSYNRIIYPRNDAGLRYAVRYTWDGDRHADIGEVTEFQLQDDPPPVPPGSPPDPSQVERFLADGNDVDASSEGLTSKAAFDGLTGRISSRTDASNAVTSYAYDTASRTASITGPLEQGTCHATIEFEYHPTATAYGYALARHYDAAHPSVCPPGSPQIRCTDPTTPSDCIETASFVDGMGRTTQSKQDGTIFVNPSSSSAQIVMIVSGMLAFDALGRGASERYQTTEPLGTIGAFNPGVSAQVTKMTWDLQDRQVKVEEPDASTTKLTYDFGGASLAGENVFRLTTVDAEGKSQVSLTDVRDNLVATLDGTPPMVTQYGYDPLGQLVTVKDPVGNLTTNAYDMLGRRKSTNTPDGGLVEFGFDAASHMTTEVRPTQRADGTSIKYGYSFNNLVSIDNPGTTPDVSYTYGTMGSPGNGAGRIIAEDDGGRSQKLTYDLNGSIASQTTIMKVHNLPTDPALAATWTTSFASDSFGRLMSLTYPDNEVLAYRYDSGGLLNSVSGVKATAAYAYLDRLEYDEFLMPRFQQTGNAVTTEYQYNPQTRRLAQQVTNSPARKIQDLNYTYDRVGNVKDYLNKLPAPVPNLYGGPSDQHYTYDAYYRLKTAKGHWDTAPDKHRDYTLTLTYDGAGVGNITSKDQLDTLTTGTGKPNVQTGTTYKLGSVSYSAVKPHQLTSANGNTYKHDPNGAFTSVVDSRNKTIRKVTWDTAGHIQNVSDGNNSTDYTNDANGQLAIERGPGGETAFVNQWVTVRNGSILWKNIWAGTDRLATQRAFDDGTYEDQRYFLHKDLQGSMNVVTGPGGNVFQHYEYFPSGETWIKEDSTVFRTPYVFSGAYFDEVRGLLNLGPRWYDPREQRFYSTDPLLSEDPAITIDDPGLLPAYTYAESNPLRLVDPSGLGGKKAGKAPAQPLTPDDELLAALKRTGLRAAIASNLDSSASFRAAYMRQVTGSRLWKWEVSLGIDPAVRKWWKAKVEKFEPNPILEISVDMASDGLTLKPSKLSLESVKLGFAYGKRKTWRSDDKSAASTGNAAGPTGGPAVNGGAPPPPPPPPPGWKPSKIPTAGTKTSGAAASTSSAQGAKAGAAAAIPANKSSNTLNSSQ